MESCDLLIVGGGINGVGIARDAAGRGLRVILCEQHDLAQHTSSASTKLIHGGLRYLEHREFKLVRKALQEREVLLRLAPHIISPLRFIMPHNPALRPAWMIRAGLFLYDHLAHRSILPGSEGIALPHHIAGEPLKEAFQKGFVYSDAWVDDARLVILNALDASERGARILTRTRCTNVVPNGPHWIASLQNADSKKSFQITARAIVNATGPWAAQFSTSCAQLPPKHALRLIKGSHIVIPKLFDHLYAYIFQNNDQRIVFAIPYQQNFTLVGTTDIEYTGDLNRPAIEADEIKYLCDLVNHYFRRSINTKDIVWTYSGVRPLLDDQTQRTSAISRDYLLELADSPLPYLNIWGGKLTTYRKLAEEALIMLLPYLGNNSASWTASRPLPGGDLETAGQLVEQNDFSNLLNQLAENYSFLPKPLATRYAHSYGTRMKQMLENARQLSDLGEEIAPNLYTVEIEYLCENEWAYSAEDILWRRTKLGLHCQPHHIERLKQWLIENR